MKTPKQVLAQIPLLANHPFLSIDQLQGGHSNQSYLISTPEVKYVLRLDGEAQSIFHCPRQFELDVLKLASKLKLSPKPIFSDLSNGILLYTFIEGQQLNIENLQQPDIKIQLADFKLSISRLGQKIKLPHPKQLLLGDISLENNLPKIQQLKLLQNSFQLIQKQLNSFSAEFCLCHNDLSTSNLLLTQHQQLIALDWEYAATNHPLLDFAFFANNFNLETDWLHKHYPDSIRHPSINFQDVRRLGWFIEAVWYAKRYQANPTEAWLKWMDQALSNL